MVRIWEKRSSETDNGQRYPLQALGWKNIGLDMVKLPLCLALYTIGQYAGTWKQALPERTRTSFRLFLSEAEGSHTSSSYLTSLKRFFHCSGNATALSFLAQECESCSPTLA